MSFNKLKVPEAGLEPALVFRYQLDFKSNASTNSATRASDYLIEWRIIIYAKKNNKKAEYININLQRN